MTTSKVLDPLARGARRFENKVCVVAGAGQGIGTGSYTTLAFNTESYDTASAYDTSAYTFTVPVGAAGFYRLYVNFRIALVNPAVVDLSFDKNAGTTIGEWTSATGLNTTSANFTLGGSTYLLAAGDVVKSTFYHNSGSTKNLTAGQYTSYFEAELIRPTWA